jgi:eukaryotic-like serine/threonine-protein kinase
MALTVGSKVGSYEVLSPIGVGGMGEVYRARDPRLNREVAIKVLPDRLTQNPDRVARFEREAKALAALNHPHIAHIYAVEPTAGSHALVMELVEGETLADRLRRGPVLVPEALALARQIAEALEAAHERGIVHRDLKPANIKLTPDGRVKVLDFGLAKLTDDGTTPGLTTAPTLTATEVGVVLGTAAYMSPEQARGLAVDKRTDIWAFGCVLYEMLTGRAVFAGDSLSDTLAAIVAQDPQWEKLPDGTPFAVRRLLRRCLNKDRTRRLRDIGDAQLELDEAMRAWDDSTSARGGSALGHRARWLVVVASLILATALTTWRVASAIHESTTAESVVRFAISLPVGESLGVDGPYPPSVAISADGQQIVYVSRGPSGHRLFLRRRADFMPVPLPNTDGALGPFFSPDGRSIGFASGGVLKTMPIAGGQPREIAPAPNLAGAVWTADDSIIYSPDWRVALSAVSAGGGQPRAITRLNGDANELEHTAPHVLPDGSHLLMAVGTGRSGFSVNQHVELVDLATGQRRRVTEGGNPAYIGGLLVFSRGNAMFAAPFDLRRLEMTGPPIRVLDGVRTDGNDTQSAVSRTGSFVYVASEFGSHDRRLVRVDRHGGTRPFVEDRAAFWHPRISPDGRRVVVQVAGEFWVYDVGRGTRTRLRARGSRPIWMPDGRSILFHATGRLFAAPVDDSAEPHLILAPERGFAFPLAWSRDGSVLAFSNSIPGTKNSRDVWMLSRAGEANPFLTTSRDERSAMFSPDGGWVVYAAKEVGREEEIYVQPYPGPGERLIVSRGGGIEPVWSPTAREIFYRSVDGRRMLAVDIRLQPDVSIGTPRLLFEGPYPVGSSYWSDYDVWPDGDEFLMVRAERLGAPEIQVVINWAAEVRRQVEPTD